MPGPDRSAMLRSFFASYVAREGRAGDPRIEQAFAAVDRERFAGPGPWSILVPGTGYIRTPDDDPAYLYQDTLVALDAERSINIGHPSSHARWLDALALREGETVLQVGAGTGYYTSLLAHLVGPGGQVHAYEIDDGLAAQAARNLADLPWVTLHHRSGLAGDLPDADAIYVNAAVTQPSLVWLDALRVGGRVLFPLHAQGSMGGMLWIEKPKGGSIWPAHFVSRANFITCVGGQDPDAGGRLTAAFSGGGTETVQSFRTDGPTDDTCWFAGAGWWLSTASTRRPIEIAPARPTAYAGRYALTPHFALTITHEDTRLMAQATGQEAFEILPETETQFFYRSIAARITFEVGPDGSMGALVLHQNGQDRRAVRVAARTE